MKFIERYLSTLKWKIVALVMTMNGTLIRKPFTCLKWGVLQWGFTIFSFLFSEEVESNNLESNNLSCITYTIYIIRFFFYSEFWSMKSRVLSINSYPFEFENHNIFLDSEKFAHDDNSQNLTCSQCLVGYNIHLTLVTIANINGIILYVSINI